jgi:BirA family biotin operon repressor/biotin-[acetyl-CoA-carboxylase] ligase
MKGKILNILRQYSEVVSGEILSSELGVSRVSIWKHIRKLQELGYDILSTPKGYQLLNTPDTPFSWELPERASRVHYFESVSSTMDIARSLARKGCPSFTVIIAGQQDKGRGRLNRSWLSSEGGLYFTVVVRPRLPVAFSGKVNFAASLALVRLFRSRFNIEAMVKWPNDILVEERKLAGILSEMEAEADMVTFINVGIGINANNDPSPIEPAATSLKILLHREISKKELLSGFLDEFERQLKEEKLNDVIEQWKEYTMTLNRHVKVVTTKDTIEGVAVDIEENGALVLRLDNGSLQKVIFGDCFDRGEAQR